MCHFFPSKIGGGRELNMYLNTANGRTTMHG